MRQYSSLRPAEILLTQRPNCTPYIILLLIIPALHLRLPPKLLRHLSYSRRQTSKKLDALQRETHEQASWQKRDYERNDAVELADCRREREGVEDFLHFGSFAIERVEVVTEACEIDAVE